MSVALLKGLVFQVKVLSNMGIFTKLVHFALCSIRWVLRSESTSQLCQWDFYSLKTNQQ